MATSTVHPTRPAVPRGRARDRGWWPDAIGAATVFSMLVVVALWVRNQGIQQLADAATGLDSLGRLTGLVAADLLIVQGFLMARVPVIERAYGQDARARTHRLVGFTSFDLMLAHVVLITFGYAGTDHSAVLHELVNLVLTY